MFNGLRALDLTDKTGFFCGKLLAHFGADVIKVEKPGGDPARNIGPFYHDIQDPDKSLYWFAYNESKKSITLNMETSEGQDIFRKLVAGSDFIIESFSVGYMESLGLNYEKLREINPRLIMISITPFGQTGPYKHYKDSDLVVMAMGGIMSQTGEPDGIPCRLDPDHAYCLAGSSAALASMIAYYYREMTGKGQFVDVSMYECALRENYNEVPIGWEFTHHNVKRSGQYMYRANVYTRCIWPCKDGYITWTIFGGKVGSKDNKALAKWMEEEGVLGELKDIDWDTFNFDDITQEKMDLIKEHILQLTARFTKRELEEQAIERGIRISAVNDVRDLYENSQLKFRNYWKPLRHPELSDNIVYPGQLFISDKVKVEPKYRAPLIGEHNKQIYIDELGFDDNKMAYLKEKCVI
jgi:crotonobetainyl-CoA:carnitine CoA-transferase CaiB-like acyl-CoA transferase